MTILRACLCLSLSLFLLTLWEVCVCVFVPIGRFRARAPSLPSVSYRNTQKDTYTYTFHALYCLSLSWSEKCLRLFVNVCVFGQADDSEQDLLMLHPLPSGTHATHAQTYAHIGTSLLSFSLKHSLFSLSVVFLSLQI